MKIIHFYVYYGESANLYFNLVFNFNDNCNFITIGGRKGYSRVSKVRFFSYSGPCQASEMQLVSGFWETQNEVFFERKLQPDFSEKDLKNLLKKSLKKTMQRQLR